MDLPSFLYIGGGQLVYYPIYYIPAPIQPQNPQIYRVQGISQFKELEKPNIILHSSAPTMDSINQELKPQPQVQKKKVIKKNDDQNFGWRNQNKDRNILSNILKIFVNYATEQQGLDKYVRQVCLKLELKTTVSDVKEFIEKQFPSSKSYISPKVFKNTFKDPTNPQALTILLKMMIVKFLKLDLNLILLKSSKIKKRSKLEQMSKARELLELLRRS